MKGIEPQGKPRGIPSIKMFNEYKKEFHFISRNDFVDAVDNFVKDFKIDILLIVPRHHQSMSSLFNSTHTMKLAYHSHIPLLAAHQY